VASGENGGGQVCYPTDSVDPSIPLFTVTHTELLPPTLYDASLAVADSLGVPWQLPGLMGGGGVPAKNGTPNYCAYQGTALSPQQYAAQGKSFATGIAALSQSYAPDVAFSFGLGTLYGQFSKGSILDAQPRATGTPLQRASYGNYAFGAFFAGAGVPLSDALTAANTYGFKQQALGGAYQGRNMDRTYTHLPAVNVQDIVNGYNAALGGTMCHR
jgi:hypothetical protein